MKEVDVELCMVCNKKFAPEDIVSINPVLEEDLKIAKDRVEFHKIAELSKKQERKRKKATEDKNPVIGGVKKKKIVVRPTAKDESGVNANISLPDLSALDKLEPSKAVASLYTDQTKKSKATWINIGNFNRYG